jgi:hypothetical protein
MVVVFAWFEYDLDRHALHDFDIIASRVFWRQEAEFGPRGGCNAIDMTLVLAAAAVRIDFDLHTLSDAHLLELRLFEIRRDPHIV